MMARSKLPFMAVAAALVAGTVGYIGGRMMPVPAEAPEAPAEPKGNPVRAAMAPLTVPVWDRGRITAFISAELTVDLTPGSRTDLLTPRLRDQLLADLYEMGAQGRLRPGIIDPAAVQAQLTRNAGTATDGRIHKLVINRLVMQDNRRQQG